MIAVLFALAVAPQSQAATIELAADTFLSKKAPDSNMGREPILEGGLEKPILIRFPELGRNTGAGKKVKSARLVFQIARPGVPRLGTVGRIRTPWIEGGFRAEQFEAPNAPKSEGTATWRSAGGASWEREGAAGRNDAEPVNGVSADATADAFTIHGLEAVVQEMVDRPEGNFGLRLGFENDVAFFSADSLGSGPQLVVEFEDRPASDVDLRLEGCEPAIGGYPLEEPTQTSAVAWQATVRNVGKVAVDKWSLSLMMKDEGSSKFDLRIEPGESKTVKFVGPFWSKPHQDRSVESFSVRVVFDGQDANPSDNGLRLYQFGLPIAVSGVSPEDALQVVTDLNERVFPFSKFGAWPNGCIERLLLVNDVKNARVVVDASNKPLRRAILQAITCLPDTMIRPYAIDPPKVGAITSAPYIEDLGQAGLLPDTRDDVLIPRGLAIPGRTTGGNSFAEIPMTEHKMLSRSETTILNTLVGKAERALPWDMTTNALFIRIFTADGPPPPGTKVDIYQLIGGAFGSQPVYSEVLEANGSVLMTGRSGGTFGKSNPFGDLNKDGTNSWLLAVVRSGDKVDSVWIPVWQLWDEYARGNQAAAFLELRVQLLDTNLDRTVNLAEGKLATDARGRFPAELMPLTDGKLDTSVSLGNEPAGYWIEIDLGRDRTMAEISLVFDGAPWKQFKILTYKTAQNAGEATVWSEETNAVSSGAMRQSPDGKTVMTYLATPVRSRYIRIVPVSREPVKLSEIRVVPANGG